MRLKELRAERGLSQKDVSDALACSVTVYSRYETGAREPSIDVLIRLADFYGVTLDELVGRTPMTVTLVQGDPPPKGEDEYELVLDPADLPQSPDDLDALIRAAVNEAVTEELKKRGL